MDSPQVHLDLDCNLGDSDGDFFLIASKLIFYFPTDFLQRLTAFNLPRCRTSLSGSVNDTKHVFEEFEDQSTQILDYISKSIYFFEEI